MASLFLMNSLTIGGSEKKVIKIVNALQKKGHRVHIAFLNRPETLLPDIDKSIPVKFLNRKGKLDFFVFSGLYKYLSQNKIEKILCINLYPSLYGTICQKLYSCKNGQTFTFVNTTDFPSRKEKLQMLVYWPLLMSSAGLIFGCETQREQWSSRYFLPKKKTSVIFNGVDSTHFSPSPPGGHQRTLRQHLNIPPEAVTVASIAAFRPEKSLSDLISACNILFQRGLPVHLVLAGDGPERERLIELSGRLGLSGRTHFLGSVNDVRPCLDLADVFALPSTSVETFSNAALEAMAMGKPVVLSDIGGAREMVQEGITGYLFRAGDVAELADKLAILLSDHPKCTTMGCNAMRMVRERFTFEAMLERYEKILTPPSLSG